MCVFERACGCVGCVLMLKSAGRIDPTQLVGSGMELEIKIKPGSSLC